MKEYGGWFGYGTANGMLNPTLSLGGVAQGSIGGTSRAFRECTVELAWADFVFTDSQNQLTVGGTPSLFVPPDLETDVPAWADATNYNLADCVVDVGVYYYCKLAHLSDVATNRPGGTGGGTYWDTYSNYGWAKGTVGGSAGNYCWGIPDILGGSYGVRLGNGVMGKPYFSWA